MSVNLKHNNNQIQTQRNSIWHGWNTNSPVIDFQAMYKSVLGEDEYVRIKKSSPSGIDILHLIEKWAPDKQLKAYQVIADYEQQGMDRLQIMPGSVSSLSQNYLARINLFLYLLNTLTV